MDRSHVYIVPESEIQVKPTLYLGYLNRYKKVEFVLQENTYEQLKSLWNEYRDLALKKETTQENIGQMLEQHELSDPVFGIFSFMMSANVKQANISIDKSQGTEVRLTIGA